MESCSVQISVTKCTPWWKMTLFWQRDESPRLYHDLIKKIQMELIWYNCVISHALRQQQCFSRVSSFSLFYWFIYHWTCKISSHDMINDQFQKHFIITLYIWITIPVFRGFFLSFLNVDRCIFGKQKTLRKYPKQWLLFLGPGKKRNISEKWVE